MYDIKDESFLVFGKNNGSIDKAESTINPLKIKNENPNVLLQVFSKSDNPTITKNRKVKT